jgi:hypothetical protein
MNFRHIKGDTFESVDFSIKVDGAALDLTGAVIRMQLKKTQDLTFAYLSLTSVADDGITITDPAGGLFKINQQIIDIEVFNYAYDIELALSSGVVKTYVSGTFAITQEITN